MLRSHLFHWFFILPWLFEFVFSHINHHFSLLNFHLFFLLGFSFTVQLTTLKQILCLLSDDECGFVIYIFFFDRFYSLRLSRHLFSFATSIFHYWGWKKKESRRERTGEWEWGNWMNSCASITSILNRQITAATTTANKHRATHKRTPQIQAGEQKNMNLMIYLFLCLCGRGLSDYLLQL